MNTSDYISLADAGIELTHSTRADMADMVGVEEAARLAGVSTSRMLSISTQRPPRAVWLHGSLGRAYPRWQFDSRIWPVAQQLPGVMQAGGAEVLAWLELPLGALQGRTPRAAIEQGESDGFILELARWSDT